MQQLPEYLYHYTTAGIVILNDLKLKSTPPIEFNDPFEFCPKVNLDKPINKNWFKQNFDQFIRMSYDREREEGSKKSFKEYKKEMQPKRKYFIKEFMSSSEAIKILYREKTPIDAGGIIGLTCFSESKNNILMWSHYAGLHSGMVIGFNREANVIQRNRVLRVDYQMERVEVDPTVDTRQAMVATRKSVDWKYEQEWRLIRLKRQCDEENINGKKMHRFKIEASDISEVCLGCRNEDDAEISRIRQKPEFSHVRWFKMEMNPDLFQLDARQI